MIVACVGSSEPLIREYVHDFGLCALNFTMLEESLRRHLEHRSMLRAEWHEVRGRKSIRGRKVMDIDAKYARLTLGGLVTEYERGGGRADLVAALRPLADDRNTLLHNHLPLTDPTTMRMSTSRIQHVRAELHRLSELARAASREVEAADLEIFDALVARVGYQGKPIGLFETPLKLMLESYRSTLRQYAEA